MKHETTLHIILIAVTMFTNWYLYNFILVPLLSLPPLNSIQVWAIDLVVTYFLVNYSDHEVTRESLERAISRTINALIIGFGLSFLI